ncbi:MAG: hypothetical protein AAF215_30930 [Cyanobacteria bacterium P01_A01_bin.123]
MTDPNSQTGLMASLPEEIQSALMTYARASELSPQSVIEYMIARFLEVDATQLEPQPPANDAPDLLAHLPLRLQAEIQQYASAIEVPSEFVIELSIAHFLDPDSVTFDDCQISVAPHLIALLKQHHQHQTATAA